MKAAAYGWKSRRVWLIITACSLPLIILFAVSCLRGSKQSEELVAAPIQTLQIALDAYLAPGTDGKSARPMKIGVDADNWSGQTKDPAFERSLLAMKVDFISWHVQPGEETVEHLNDIVLFCRKHGWSYLFNTEWGNYNREDAHLVHGDGTVRYDLAESTLQMLKDDPLFLGVIYDEAELMQAMNGVPDEKGKKIAPYFVETRSMTALAAFDAVSNKVSELQKRYQSYGKRLIFEMVFPDYPFAFARGGALLAPKLLKETSDDLMYSVYRGAALEYHSNELWACADLWFLDHFPFSGERGEKYHTPQELLDTLRFANAAGFDYIYVEQAKGLMSKNYELTDYGRAVVQFQETRSQYPRGDWRTAPISHYIRRFPDGYWGQAYSTFIPDHPYGSWLPNPFRASDERWFAVLADLSHGSLPKDANTWNAVNNPFFAKRSYSRMAGLPLMVVYDHYSTLPSSSNGVTIVDLCHDASCSAESGK